MQSMQIRSLYLLNGLSIFDSVQTHGLRVPDRHSDGRNRRPGRQPEFIVWQGWKDVDPPLIVKVSLRGRTQATRKSLSRQLPRVHVEVPHGVLLPGAGTRDKRACNKDNENTAQCLRTGSQVEHMAFYLSSNVKELSQAALLRLQRRSDARTPPAQRRQPRCRRAVATRRAAKA